MTNETTASQPKSIGDDAQFHRLMSEWQLCLTTDITKSFAAVVSYIDNFRAPAAQASATIQAAPIGWTAKRVDGTGYGNILYSDPQCAEIAISHNGPAAPKYEIAPVFAATIQEPVMVAEPVDKFAAEVYTAMRCFDGTWGQGSNEMRRSALEAEASRLMHASKPAAPMVADPAGVELDERVRCISIVESLGWTVNGTWVFTKSGERLHSIDAMAFIGATIRFHVATTDKAVPSEALELAQAEIAALRNLKSTLVGALEDARHFMTKSNVLKDETLKYVEQSLQEATNFAAPLADKTGGGE